MQFKYEGDIKTFKDLKMRETETDNTSLNRQSCGKVCICRYPKDQIHDIKCFSNFTIA